MGYADELFDLTDQVVLVTGGSRGLGREMVMAFAEAGADVVIASRKYDTCVAAAEEIAAATGRAALALRGARRALGRARRAGRRGVRPLRQGRRARQQRGHVAAVPVARPVTEKLFDTVVNLNLKGPFRLSTLVGERMADRRRRVDHQRELDRFATAVPGMLPYAAAKAGLNALTEVARAAFGPTVRVNTLMRARS